MGTKAQPAQYESAGTKPAPDRTVDLSDEMHKADAIDELSSAVTVIKRNSVTWTEAVKILIVRFAEWAGWLTSLDEGVVQAYLRTHTASKL